MSVYRLIKQPRPPLLTKLIDPKNINRAWKHLRHDRAPWSPGISKQEATQNLPLHLLSLIDEVNSGAYRPLPVRQYQAKKISGGSRTISTYYLKDKVVQRSLQQILIPIGESIFHFDSYAYRPNRNVDGAIAKANERISLGLKWLVDADVKSFFDRVPHRSLLKILRKYIKDRQLYNLLKCCLETGPHPNCVAYERRGLLQGSALSPVLCNFYLHQLDCFWSQHNIAFVRYADDFLLMLPGQTEARDAYELTESYLNLLKLELNAAKTHICHVRHGIKFLGQRLGLRKMT